MNLLPEWGGSRFPPGGYPYQDEKTGKVFDAMAGGLDDRVRQVREHRLANKHIFTDQSWFDTGFIRNQIVEYMCNRRPELCIEGLKAAIPNPAKTVVDATCPKCQSKDVAPKYCQSCGGSKIEAFVCNQCSARF